MITDTASPVPTREIVDELHHIVVRLERLAQRIEDAGLLPPSAAEEQRVCRVLQRFARKGTEDFTMDELLGIIRDGLDYLEEPPVPDAAVRQLLPKLLKELLGLTPSHSLRRDGRFCRGFRRLDITNE